MLIIEKVGSLRSEEIHQIRIIAKNILCRGSNEIIVFSVGFNEFGLKILRFEILSLDFVEIRKILKSVFDMTKGKV